jgi:hypothetical protein
MTRATTPTLHVVKPEPEQQRKAPHCYDKDFKYVHSSKSDIRKTFARIKRELAKTRRP